MIFRQKAYVSFFERGSQNSKFSQFQIFPKLGPRGVVVKFPIFPNFKKVQNILGEWGSRKLWTFSTFCDIFLFECFPKLSQPSLAEVGVGLSLAIEIGEERL